MLPSQETMIKINFEYIIFIEKSPHAYACVCQYKCEIKKNEDSMNYADLTENLKK